MSVYMTKTSYYCRGQVDGERYNEPCKTWNYNEATIYDNATRTRIAKEHAGLLPTKEERKIIQEKNKVYYFQDMVDIYLKVVEGKASISNDLHSIATFLEFWGNCPVKEITPLKIEQFRTQIKFARRNSNRTINMHLQILKAIFYKAMDENENIATHNPVRKVKPLPEKPHRTRYLTDLEEKRLFTELKRVYTVQDSKTRKPTEKQPYLYLHDMVLTALRTGMRRKELFRLKWEQVDFRYNYINVYDFKNNDSRIVPMSKEVRELLMNKERLSEYVFTNPRTGTHYYDIKKAWSTILKKAGIENFLFHDNRHTFGTRVISNGGDIEVARDLLGHKHTNTTQRYTHAIAAKKYQIVNKIHKC